MTRPSRRALPTVAGWLALWLVPGALPAAAHAVFRFPDDAFGFANETVWEYEPDPATGRTGWSRRQPRPDFVLRCGTMVRAARQFHVHARFDPDRPLADPETYERLVREVLDRDPRRQTPASDSVVIPGYPDLATFSRERAPLLKRALSGPWQSYLQRGNWRMIFPFTARQQRSVAETLTASLARGAVPIVHVLRFPMLTINHMLLLFAVDETPAEVRFQAYDPNDAERPVVLRYDRGARTFLYQRTPYFGGGPVRVYEIYDGLLY
jgi:hypothetical protein